MAKSSTPTTATAAPDPIVLSAAQIAAIDALDYPIPAFKQMSTSEVGGLGAEALEGYFYGERTRYDSSGKKWFFQRAHENNRFTLTIRVSVGDLLLAETSMPLDQIASLEGERQIVILVEAMAVQSVRTAKAALAYQQARRPEAAA
jgi:hypothetical protein